MNSLNSILKIGATLGSTVVASYSIGRIVITREDAEKHVRELENLIKQHTDENKKELKKLRVETMKEFNYLQKEMNEQFVRILEGMYEQNREQEKDRK